MRLMPWSSVAFSTPIAASWSPGGPQTPSPVIRIAPSRGGAPRCPRNGRRRPRPRSQDRQVSVQLPRGDLHAVVLPLLALDLDVAVEHVLAQRAQDELGLRGDLDRLAERLG